MIKHPRFMHMCQQRDEEPGHRALISENRTKQVHGILVSHAVPFLLFAYCVKIFSVKFESTKI